MKEDILQDLDILAEFEKKDNEIQRLNAEICRLQGELNRMESSRSWRITALLRKTTTALRFNRYTGLILKGIRSLRQYGIRVTWAKVKNKIRYARMFGRLHKRPLYTKAELEAQRKEVFPRSIKISILVPLYNTPEKFLREMIQSVLDQTYANWELCLADGSDAQHENVGQICLEYARKDHRICYQKLEKNMGISGNTNACIEMATGDYIALFDHDDHLHPAALHDVMKEICEKNADFVYTDEATFESPGIKRIISVHHKPDYAIDNLRANNYICHLNVFKRELLEKTGGGFRSEYDGSQDHDLMLRLTAEAECIVHIPKVLYYWRSHPQSVAQDISAKTYAITAGKNAVRDSIKNYGYDAIVESSRAFPTIYRIKYNLKDTPKVSIIIPNKNNVAALRRCVESIFTKSTYQNYEIIIVDNASDDTKTLAYYNVLKKDSRIKVCHFDNAFNFSQMNNFAVKQATGQYYVFLNNDTEVITPEWIEELLMYVQREDVAAAGAKLYFPNDTIQHAGIILGLGQDRIAGHQFYRCGKWEIGYMGRLCYAQNMSAVTAACMMVKASVFHEIGEFDEGFAVAYNDVDLCMRIRQAGYLIVWTPYAELYHYESKSRGAEDTPEKQKRFQGEIERFQRRWAKELAAGDPYYNPNFTLDCEDFSIR